MAILNGYYYEITQTYWPFQYWDGAGSDPYWTPYTKNNGWQLYRYLTQRGFALDPICGILGNAMSESTGLNPGQEENNLIFSLQRGGLGFIQWTNTSGTNKIYAANPNQWFDGAFQAQVIADEVDPSTADGSYFQNDLHPEYYLPNAQFMQYNGHDLDFITKTYFYSRERGTWDNIRSTYASMWYTILTGEEPPEPPGPGPGPGPGPTPTHTRLKFIKKRQNYKRRVLS